MAFLALEKLMNLQDGYRKTFVHDRQEFMLLQEAGQTYIVQANCPHLHWPLLQASVNGQEIMCKKHGFAFNLLTGKPVNAQAQSCNALKVLSIVYEGANIGIDV